MNAEAFEDTRPSDHPVFNWIDQSTATYKGIVKQINYSRHGEPNGSILDDGAFVHLYPEGAKAVNLKIGQKLLLEGEARTSPSGHAVIEARLVNGLALEHGKKAKRHAA